MSYSAPIPYIADAAAYYTAIADLPWAVWLDSGGRGRYDILCAQPVATLVTCGTKTMITNAAGMSFSDADPFDLLRQQLDAPLATMLDIPFAGGVLGYWGYDLARRFMVLPALAEDAEHLPDMAVGIYDWAIVLDHQQKTAQLVSQQREQSTAQVLPDILARLQSSSYIPIKQAFKRDRSLDSIFTPTLALPLEGGERSEGPNILLPPSRGKAGMGVKYEQNGAFHSNEQSGFKVHGQITSNFTRAAYESAFDEVQRYLRAGDCYQVNLAQRYAARASGDALPAYLELRRLSPAPYSAFLNLPQAQILCASPECFLQVRAGRVETRPIKGTRPRMADAQQDQQMTRELQYSAKDRAENLMIVDLLRNDLGKSCVPGSVQAPKLFEVESFAQVHHLVSTVTGQLAPGQDALALLRNCFPGGSVTGAPKQRAMEIIEQLEPQRRGVYCGSVGYIGFDGNMECNIAIRTLVYSNDEIRFWAGGGVVADSEVEAEYQETLDKAGAMVELLRRFGGEYN